MRTLSTAQQDILEGTAYSVHLRIDVENSTGGFVDLSNVAGTNWCDGLQWGEDIDQPVSEATLFLRRDITNSTGASLSPLDAASTLNMNSTSGYAPLIQPGREVRCYTATLAVGSTPTSTQWQEVFRGEIDTPAWGGRESRVQVGCRDLGGVLQDRWIESPKGYGDSTGIALETVMQSALDDVLGSTDVELYTPTSPGFLVTNWTQDSESLFDSLRTMADWIGWDVRYRWDNTSTAFRLTLADPRASTASVYTHSPSRYLDVTDLQLDRKDVRNVVRVRYYSNGAALTVTATSTESIDSFGRRFMEIGEPADSPIDTSSEATTLAEAALADLMDPKADQEIEQHYFWPVQLWDVNTYTANGIHYDTDQQLAVVSYRHEVMDGRGRTRIRARGNPAGAYNNWLRRGRSGGGGSTELTGTSIEIALSQPTSNTIQLDVTGLGTDAATWEAWMRLNTWPTSDDTETGTPLDLYSVFEGPRSVRSISKQASTGTWYAVARGVTSSGLAGVADSTNLLVSAASSGTLGVLADIIVRETTGRDYHHISWWNNDTVEASTAFYLTLESNIAGTILTSTDAYDPRYEYDGSSGADNRGSYRASVSGCVSGTTGCSYVTYEYTIGLYELPATLRGTYTASISNYYIIPDVPV